MANYHIYSGMISSGLTLSGWDYMYIHSGGTANSTTVNSAGAMLHISSGGTANHTIVNCGAMYISEGGTANSTTVNDGGAINIQKGTTLNSLTLSAGGYLNGFAFADDKYFEKITDGLVIVANNITINGDNMYISSGGIANNTTNNSWMHIYSGGTANHTTVNCGAMYISEGGIANCTTVQDWGNIVISSGGTANSTILSGPSACICISSGGTANSTTVKDWGCIVISSGGTANNTTVDHGIYTGGLIHISEGGIANSTTLNAGEGIMYISSGGTANSTTVNSGRMDIYNGGIANNTTVNSGGDIEIYKGTTLNSLTLSAGGYLNGFAFADDKYFEKITDGSVLISDNIIIDGIELYISSGGTANCTTVRSGSMYISSGGTANCTTVEDWGCIVISSGGVANNTTVGSDYNVFSGFMHISSGGTANSTTINDGGYMYISSGGTANSTTVNLYGSINILLGGTASNTIITSLGYMHIDDGGVANNIVVKPGAQIDISYGGRATVEYTPWKNNITITGDGDIQYLERDANIYYGNNKSGVISKYDSSNYLDVTSGNSAIVYSNGLAKDTTVNSGGIILLSSCAFASDTIICSGGSMIISSGGVHRGSLNIASGGYVYNEYGAVIDFNLTDRKPKDTYLINDLSLITGNVTYTITVDEIPLNGTYKLAQGADGLIGTFLIGNEYTTFGTISVNGNICRYDGVTYTLDRVKDTLTLTVTGGKNPAVEDDLDGNGLADTVLVHTKQGYSGAWLTTGDKSVIKWGDLGNVNSKVEVVGMGNVYGTSEEGSDIYLKIGTTVATWVTNEGKLRGYKELYTLKSNMNMLGIGDFDGDGVTDYLLRSNTGDLGYVTGDDNNWHYIKGLGTEWKIAAVGDLDGNGTDDVIIRHDAGFTGAYMIGTDGKITWSNLDTLKSDMTIVGTGDFNGDGVDDVLLQNKSNGWVGAWLVEDGNVDSFIGLCKNKNAIEQIADFNGDGIDDLRIRTDKGDIGVLYVKGADTTEWKYFQSVGKEWDTSFSLIS